MITGVIASTIPFRTDFGIDIVHTDQVQQLDAPCVMAAGGHERVESRNIDYSYGLPLVFTRDGTWE